MFADNEGRKIQFSNLGEEEEKRKKLLTEPPEEKEELSKCWGLHIFFD